MAETDSIARAVIDALNARDFAALAGKVHEDVVISGIGGSGDNGREALRDRLARHFEAFDESYGDGLAMSDASGRVLAVRVTARGRPAGGDGYSRDRIILLEVEDGLITRFSIFAEQSS